MEHVEYSVPRMWADHHVPIARSALLGLPGVEDVYASSAWKTVKITYDASKVSPDALQKALADAGYPVGAELELPTYPEQSKDGAMWYVVADRVVDTNIADLKMSGDHRKY